MSTEKYPPFHPAAPRVTAREQPVPRGCAARGGRVRVSEPDTHARQPFHLWRVQLYIVRVAGEILIRARVSHPHVVRHEENDIGFGSRLYRQRQDNR